MYIGAVFVIIRGMTFEALIFTFSILGISETVYLIKKRILSEKPVCPVNEDCTKVLSSKYNKLFLIPNDVLGLIFYIVCSLIAAFLVIIVQPLSLWYILLSVLVLVGSIISMYFTYLQFNVIRAWCFWCLMSACTIWLMGVTILLNNIL